MPERFANMRRKTSVTSKTAVIQEITNSPDSPMGISPLPLTAAGKVRYTVRYYEGLQKTGMTFCAAKNIDVLERGKTHVANGRKSKGRRYGLGGVGICRSEGRFAKR